MRKKLKVMVLFGGRSAEHEVSLQSAKSVIEALDKDKYEIIPVGIGKDGRWYLPEKSTYLLNSDNPKLIKLNQSNANVLLAPGDNDHHELVSLQSGARACQIDVVFPVLHGTYGEDGTVQGLLRLANVPFVGAGTLGSAVGMDKDVFKRLLRDADIPTARFLVFKAKEKSQIDAHSISVKLGLPIFVKPANLGSSVGVSKAHSQQELVLAIEHAFRYDRKILIEEFIPGREIECSVLGNDEPIASLPGEIIPTHEFYSYNAKYIDERGAELVIPAKLDPETTNKIQSLSVKTFKAACCEGMARVDLFLADNGQLYINEINTIPGFTKISMYPKLWEASGISYRELLDRLIELAVERHRQEQELKTTHDFA